MPTIFYIPDADITVTPTTPLGVGAADGGNTGAQLDGATIAISPTATLTSFEASDNDDFFNDNDGNQRIDDPLASGLPAGDVFQAEYTLTLDGDGGPFTAIGLVSGPGLKNVVGLSFIGETPPPGAVLTVTETADGPAVGDESIAFSSLATVICFTPGTMILTEAGMRAIETLGTGDRIVTRDNGVQTLRWAGTSHLTAGQLQAAPHLAPVLIKAGAFGPGLPARDMHVSPNHRFLVDGWRAQTLFGHAELLVRAQAMRNDSTIVTDRSVASVDYIHLMFDRHEVITADGVATESFQPSAGVTQGLDARVRDEIMTLFPQLKTGDLGDLARPARTTLSDTDAQAFLAG